MGPIRKRGGILSTAAAVLTTALAFALVSPGVAHAYPNYQCHQYPSVNYQVCFYIHGDGSFPVDVNVGVDSGILMTPNQLATFKQRVTVGTHCYRTNADMQWHVTYVVLPPMGINVTLNQVDVGGGLPC